MSVALKKVDGVSSVNVTLKRGVAHIALDAGNSVSLPQLRGIIKDAGYTTRDAVVTATDARLVRTLPEVSAATLEAADAGHPYLALPVGRWAHDVSNDGTEEAA